MIWARIQRPSSGIQILDSVSVLTSLGEWFSAWYSSPQPPDLDLMYMQALLLLAQNNLGSKVINSSHLSSNKLSMPSTSFFPMWNNLIGGGSTRTNVQWKCLKCVHSAGTFIHLEIREWEVVVSKVYPISTCNYKHSVVSSTHYRTNALLASTGRCPPWISKTLHYSTFVQIYKWRLSLLTLKRVWTSSTDVHSFRLSLHRIDTAPN